jgi:hypothetical protein
MKPLQFAHPERVPNEPYAALLACYRSGQMSERQWEEHKRDPMFRLWLERRP